MKQILGFVLFLVIWSGGWYYIAAIPTPVVVQKPLTDAELAKNGDELRKILEQQKAEETSKNSHKLAEMIFKAGQSSSNNSTWRADSYTPSSTASAVWDWLKEFITDIRITDALIASFTGMLALVTWKLANYTKQLSESTESLVKGAEDTAKRQLRAYLSFKSDEGEKGFHSVFADLRCELRAIITNHGQTQAIHCDCRVGYKFIEEPYPNSNGFQDADKSFGTFTLAPNESHHILMPIKFPSQDIMNSVLFPKGNRKLFIHGSLAYQDIYGDRHEIMIRYRLEWSRGTGQPPTWMMLPDAEEEKTTSSILV